jgi:hypothetical protein
MSAVLPDQPRIWSAETDPIIANHWSMPVNSAVAEGELFTRLCHIRVPEFFSSPANAIKAYEAETVRLRKIASIAVLPHEFVLIRSADIDTSVAGLAFFMARQDRVLTQNQACRNPNYYLGAIVPKITVNRAAHNRSGMRKAVGKYYVDSVLNPSSGVIIEDIRDTQLTMRHDPAIQVPYIMFDLDVRLSSRE